MKIGIDSLSFYVPGQYLSLGTLANKCDIDPEKFYKGLGQEKVAFPAHDEDIVTMAAEAALPIIEAKGVDGINTVLFATESGVDQSKAAGIYVHQLLNLPPECRTVELKQACYGATAAIQMACALVARKPESKVLVLASDISRYDIDSPAEATQGCGAAAMLITANPNVLAIDIETGCHTQDIMDFWRPNYRKTPMVDGKYSMSKYLESLEHSWRDYQNNGGHAYTDFSHFCYHLPFCKMGVKAHQHLSEINQIESDTEQCALGMIYNRQIGNCYAAALYVSLNSVLDNCKEDLTNKPIGIFSYGSGAVSEFFSVIPQPGYKEHLFTNRHKTLLEERKALSYEEYIELWHAPEPEDGSETVIAKSARGKFRLARFYDHKRDYQRCD